MMPSNIFASRMARPGLGAPGMGVAGRPMPQPMPARPPMGLPVAGHAATAMQSGMRPQMAQNPQMMNALRARMGMR
jgi:hypothetical protein